MFEIIFDHNFSGSISHQVNSTIPTAAVKPNTKTDDWGDFTSSTVQRLNYLV